VNTDEDNVVLVDDLDQPIGHAARNAVHTDSTPRHLAFSCWIVDPGGSVLITQRSLTKRAWPGVWTNSCCGHPRPGEPIEVAVARRVTEELGVEVGAIECLLPDFSYRATDASGVVENEFCPVFRAVLRDPAGLRPVPDEVMSWVWVHPEAVITAVGAAPYAFSPWAVRQLERLGPSGLAGQPLGEGVPC
jgi:isopentenyl-diphosphate delta-isomerase